MTGGRRDRDEKKKEKEGGNIVCTRQGVYVRASAKCMCV